MEENHFLEEAKEEVREQMEKIDSSESDEKTKLTLKAQYLSKRAMESAGQNVDLDMNANQTVLKNASMIIRSTAEGQSEEVLALAEKMCEQTLTDQESSMNQDI